MSHWNYVADTDEIPTDKVTTFRVQEEEVLVYRIRHNYYVYANHCTHQSVPLSDGHLVKGTIVCRLHGAKFDLQTGACLRSPAYENLHAYPIEIRDGQLYVKLSPPP